MPASSVTVQGMEQVQAALFKLLEAAKPSGGLGKAVTYATGMYAKGTAAHAHKLTGTLAASQTPEVDGLAGKVYTKGNVNPLSHTPASTYAPFEEARGGSHALYSTTFGQDTAKIASEALSIIVKELP